MDNDDYVNTQQLNTTLNKFFNTISENEQFDMASFDYLPNYFHNLNTKLFGSSNNNNFLWIYFNYF